jgi:PhzF family phenazine biosynthesis protein
MNCPESAFILPSTQGDFRLRYFTCSGDEIKFCGHATIGALEAVYREQRFGVRKSGNFQLKVETLVGLLTMEILAEEGRPPLYKMGIPKIDLVPATYALDDLRRAMDLPTGILDTSQPLMLERTHNYLYFAVPSLEHMKSMKVDTRGLHAFAQKDRLVLFCALTPHAINPANHVHCRAFAPLVGIQEYPFTGSMQGGVAAYMLRQKMIAPDATEIGSEQGHFMGRPGEAKIALKHHPEIHACLYAQAVSLFNTEMVLP